MNVEETLKSYWVWKVHGSYGYFAVNQHDSTDESNATYSSCDLAAVFENRGTADQVAAAMNKAYEAGIERGRAEILSALMQHVETMPVEGAEFLDRLLSDVYRD